MTDTHRTTIFLFLSIRSYISDLLQTPYLEYLSTKYHVVVFLPESQRASAQGYLRNSNITYIHIPEPNSKFFTLFDGLLRNELIHRFDENPAVVWRNKRVTESRRLFLRRVSLLVPKKTLSPNFFSRVEALFIPGYRAFSRYVLKYKPALVLTATPGMFPFDTYAIHCAKKAGIPSVAVNFSWDNLTVYPRHVRKTDYLICWNNTMKREALELHGFREDRIFVSGTPRFDHYFRAETAPVSRNDFLSKKGLNPKHKTILFAAKTQGVFYKDFIRSFIGWRKNGELSSVNLFVRIHPLDSLSAYDEFMGIENIHIERAGTLKQDDSEKGQKIEMNKDDLLNMKHTLQYTDICLNVSSTVSIEAMVFDKPVINIGFVPLFSDILSFPHYRPLIEKKAVRVARSMEDLLGLIQRYLKNPAADKAGRQEIIDAMIRPTDGFSYKRSVDFLDVILKEEGL